MWHHPGGATTQLTKKAPPSLKLIWSLSETRYSNFHSKFQLIELRAFQRGEITFPGSTGCKMAGRQSSKCETNFHFLAIYIVKYSPLQIKPTFWSFPNEMAFFKWSWQRVKVLPRPWASKSKLSMIRPLKWGTLRLWTPNGFKMANRQIWKNEKNVFYY